MPAAPTAGALAALPAEQRGVGSAVLGCIQVAGAASLGVGRLTAFRVAIFERCVDGDPLDQRPTTRLARLCTPDPERTRTRDGVDLDPSADALELIDQVGLHGWHHRAASLDDGERLAALEEMAAHNREWKADHIVLREWSRAAADEARVETALSGSRIAVVG
jgi:hypothetical protein